MSYLKKHLKIDLTTKQAIFFKYLKEKGFKSYRKMAKELGFKSVRSIMLYLKPLSEKGYIKQTHNRNCEKCGQKVSGYKFL